MATKISDEDVIKLIELVGGKENITSLTPCITRLGFTLNTLSLANTDEIRLSPMVKGCIFQAGQFQVIIGTNVNLWYAALLPEIQSSTKENISIKALSRSDMRWHERRVSHFTEIFFPVLPALISRGLILGFRNVRGLPAILSIKPFFWSFYAAAMLVAIAIPLLLTLAIYKRKQVTGSLQHV